MALDCLFKGSLVLFFYAIIYLGHGEETDKSFHYMVEALEDFIKVLHEEAETPQQKEQLMQALQNSMR